MIDSSSFLTIILLSFLFLTGKLNRSTIVTILIQFLVSYFTDFLSILTSFYPEQLPDFTLNSLSSSYFFLKSLIYNKYIVFAITLYTWLETLLKLLINFPIFQDKEFLSKVQLTYFMMYLFELDLFKASFFLIQEIFLLFAQNRLNFHPENFFIELKILAVQLLVFCALLSVWSLETLVVFFVSYELMYAFFTSGLFFWFYLGHGLISFSDEILVKSFNELPSNMKRKFVYILQNNEIHQSRLFFGYLFLAFTVIPEVFFSFSYWLFDDNLFIINCVVIYFYSLPVAFLMNASQDLTGQEKHVLNAFSICFSILVFVWGGRMLFGFELEKHTLSLWRGINH